MAIVVASVATVQNFVTLFGAKRVACSTFDRRWQDFVSTGTSESLVHHNGTFATLVSMTFPRTRMDVTLKHLSTEFHALVLQSSFDCNTAGNVASMHTTALFLLADLVTEVVI